MYGGDVFVGVVNVILKKLINGKFFVVCGGGGYGYGDGSFLFVMGG